MESDAEPRNRLNESDSPYLLQHAENPVHWYPWGGEAFERARATDRPIFLSIGYSTCHWCHVMAHESFEDEDVAELLNERFVSIKVDREERPDIDSVYMTACQMMTGRGGWPLTVIMTPEGEPFFAGTYFPKSGRGGRPGLTGILERIAELWETRREDVLRTAEEAVGALERTSAGGATGSEGALDEELLETAFEQLRERHDAVHGGFGSAPKFPSPHNLLFLLRYGDRTGEEALEMVRTTLHGMRRGGIWDQVGFGFHRYSTDARWFVPHFEKMLYDQALLALACTETWQASGDELCGRTARQVFTYLLRDLRDPAGGFHSAEDADSEGGEGKFYVWTEAELREVLSEEEFALAKRLFRTEERGNFVEEASGRRTGENILHLARPLDETARDMDEGEEELRARVEGLREKLFAAREKRPRPHRDDKVLTDWNGLAIAALARGGAAFEDEQLVEAAREVAGFLLGTMRGEGGRLLHRYRDGRAAIHARADDYAFLIWGLIELYGATLEVRWLREALRLQEEFTDFCWDEERGGYFLAPSDATDLPVRPREARDGALPSANSVAAWNLLRLARMTGSPALEEREDAIERAFADDVSRAPTGHTQMLVALDFRLGPTREVVLAGRRDSEELGRMLEILRRGFWPRAVMVHRPDAGDVGDGDEAEEPEIVRLAEYTREQRALNGVSAYVCRDFTCERPTGDPEEMRRLLAT